MPPCRRRRWPWVLLGILGLLVLLVAWTFWPVSAPPLQVGRETTYLAGPLRADGTVDYLAGLNELASAGVTTENNAAIPMLQAMGPGVIEPQVRAAVLAELGISSLPEDGDYFVDLLDYLRQTNPQALQREEDGIRLPMDGHLIVARVFDMDQDGWLAEDLTMRDAWLQAIDGPLDRVVEATRKPRWYMPTVSQDQTTLMLAVLPNLGSIRSAAKALALRATVRADAGDIDGAWSDAMALHRLARLVGQGGTLIGRLVGAAIESLACQTDLRIARQLNLPPERAKAMLADLRGLGPVPSVVEGIDVFERCATLDALQHAFGAAKSRGMEQLTVISLLGGIDRNQMFRSANAYYDQFTAALRIENCRQRWNQAAKVENDAVAAWNARFAQWKTVGGVLGYVASTPRAKMRHRTQLLTDLLMSILLPSLTRADSIYVQATMHREITEVALALAAYRGEKGGYPRDLSALVPDYLPQLPQDVFAGQALIYKPAGDGYLLYSVGYNQMDDGGDDGKANRNADDVVARVGVPASQPAESEEGREPEESEDGGEPAEE